MELLFSKLYSLITVNCNVTDQTLQRFTVINSLSVDDTETGFERLSHVFVKHTKRITCAFLSSLSGKMNCFAGKFPKINVRSTN